MMSKVTDNLRDHQRQLDEDGVMVGVSRQAVVETLAEIEQLREALKPFAVYAAGIAEDHPGWDHDNFDFQLPDNGPTMRHFRAARDAFGINRPAHTEDAGGK